MKNKTARRLFNLGLFIGFCLMVSQTALAQNPVPISTQADIQVSSNELDQGDVVLLTITAAKDVQPALTWRNKEIPLAVNQEKTKWFGFLEAGLGARPGKNLALIKLTAEGQTQISTVEITIRSKDYGVRDLILPKEMVDLDKPTLERVLKENKVLATVWSQVVLERLWQGPFIRPVSGEEVGPFGRKSIINHLPRAPHSGVDLRGETGTPIRAANAGRVVLIADHFFTGNTVIIDHGGHIQSMYFHMSQVAVETGQMVAKGDVIGQIGATGRVTGPHLHFGMRVNATNVDPLHFILVSEQITEP